MSARATAAELLSRLVRGRLLAVGIGVPASVQLITATDLAAVKRQLEGGATDSENRTNGLGGKGEVGVVGRVEEQSSDRAMDVPSESIDTSSTDTSKNVSPTPSQLAREVFEHWRATYDKPKAEFTEQIEYTLVELLAHPFTVEQLKQHLDLVRDNPALIKRRQVRPAILTVFRSARLVCTVLGVKYVAKASSWLEPFDLVWQRHYGAPLPFGIAAKVLRPLVERHGAADVERRFDTYCGATAAAYVSIPKFAQTYGTWGSAEKGRGARTARPGAGSMVEGL